MRQIFQNLRTGAIEIDEIPCPEVKKGHLLIRTDASLISAGTERMLIEFGKTSLLGKARRQPDKIRQVLNMFIWEGVGPTLELVNAKLDQFLPLGYSNVGRVLDVGKDVKDFSSGDRVLSNGPHAEIVHVPKNLCAKIPDEIENDAAAFTVIGAIGLQGIRLIQPTLGENIVVIGLGLIGLTTIQLLKAHGCRVLGVDLDSRKYVLARQFGAEVVEVAKGEDPVAAALDFSHGYGVDGVLITAATESSEPVHQAALMCRKRGRIVLVGVTGLELNRSDFYEKELSFQVSCSYGPGRYDPEYEEKGHDYPIGYVRWTEKRNFQAVLELMATGKLNVKPLVTHKFSFIEAEKAYELITGKVEPYLGIILDYPKDKAGRLGHKPTDMIKRYVNLTPNTRIGSQNMIIGLIGAGNFAKRFLLPALKKTNIQFKTIASSGGISATHLAKKFNFMKSTTDVNSIFEDTEISTVFIASKHDTHAHFVIEALKSGKHVFVEKPLCITNQELDKIIEVYNTQITTETPKVVMVGFNRRFAPHVLKMKELLDVVKKPKSMVMTINAGSIPPDHWTQDPGIGGGRIIGEACHFVDLLCFLSDKDIVDQKISKMKNGVGDTLSIQLTFGDGSIGTIHYFANGNNRFPKERLEVFCGGMILQLDNFKILKGYKWKGFKKMKLRRQDKGHTFEVKSFVKAIQKGEPSPIPFEESVKVMRATIQIAKTVM